MRIAIRTFLLTAALAAAAGPAGADTLSDLEARFEREKGKDFSTRYATINEIAGVGTVEALRFLERVEKDDKDASIRSNALHAIARVDVPESAETLLRLYKDGDPNRRSNILSAWTNYRKEDLPATVVAEALASRDLSARSSLVNYLGRRDDPRFLPEARRFLQDFPASATSITSYLTQHPSAASAAMVLSTYDDDRAYDRDTIPKFFAGAAPEVRAVLVSAIMAGRDPLLGKAAQIAARAKIAEAEDGLVAAARGAKDDERRATFLEDAGRVGLRGDAGQALAVEVLKSPVEKLVVAGARALRARPTAAAVPTLLELLHAKSETVRVEARITLEATTGEDFGDKADLWDAWWRDHASTFDVAKVKPRSAGAVDRALVDLALAKGAAALRLAASSREPKDAKGPWEYGGHPVGTTALVLLALHAAGSDPKEKVFSGALKWLVEQPVPAQTYDAGIVAMTLETVGGKRFKGKIAEASKFLVATQNAAGFWGYPTGNGDHSNTQYAVLGLRHAARAGVTVPAKTWKAIRDHLLATQDSDGGWSYMPQSKKDVSSTSMTAAGVSCLLICLENGDPADPRRDEALAALDRGFKALGSLAKFDKDTLYALYGMERAGMLGNRPAFGGVPWYAPGAKRILDEQGRDGYWTGQYHRTVDSAFAILFLKKATPPVAGATTKSEAAPPTDFAAPTEPPAPADPEPPATPEEPATPK